METGVVPGPEEAVGHDASDGVEGFGWEKGIQRGPVGGMGSEGGQGGDEQVHGDGLHAGVADQRDGVRHGDRGVGKAARPVRGVGFGQQREKVIECASAGALGKSFKPLGKPVRGREETCGGHKPPLGTVGRADAGPHPIGGREA